MEQIIFRLENCKNRRSTAKNYLQVWRNFNKFLLRLDAKPDSWERQTAMFCTFLIDQGSQSSTIKSYVSAIKSVLRSEGYQWNDDLVLLNSLTRACHMINDQVYQRLPIKKGMLELLLFEVERMFSQSKYNEVLYKAIFLMAFYRLMRMSEIAAETGEFSMNHAVMAADVYVGMNKPKILVLLYSSKTHGSGSQPQEIKIYGIKCLQGQGWKCAFLSF